MPVLLAENIVQLEMADLAKRRPIDRPDRPLARAAGHHQSGILQFIAHKVGWLKPGEPVEEDYPLIWGLGQAIEEYTFSFYPNILWQPGQRTVDGISMNCDGMSLDMDLPLIYRTATPVGERWFFNQIEECKATYKSVATGDEFVKDPKWAMYNHQGREYCYGYGPRVVRFHVWHIRGDYKVFGPCYKQYVVGYSDAEVGATHRMLLKYKPEVEMERGVA